MDLGPRIPLPFAITIYGTAYDTGGGEAIFVNREKLTEKIEAVIQKEVRDGVDLDLSTMYHPYVFRPRSQWGDL